MTGPTSGSPVPGSTSATQQVHLVEAPVPRNLGQHFAIRVGDLDAVVDELRSKGIEVADPVTIGANRQTFINDPAGNAGGASRGGRNQSLTALAAGQPQR